MQRATVSFHRFHSGTIFGLASDGVYRACYVTTAAVSSYLAFPPLHPERCGLFLLHFPWSRLHRVLPGALPCGARTFLTPKRAAIQSAQIFNPPPQKESCRNFHILQYCLLLSGFGELLTEAAFCSLRNGLPPILP